MEHSPHPPTPRCSLSDAQAGLQHLRDRAATSGRDLDQTIDTFYAGMGDWLEDVRTEMACLATAFDALAPDTALDTAQETLSRVEASARLLRDRLPSQSTPSEPDGPWTPADLRSNMAALRAQLKADREQRASEAAADRAAFLASLRSDVLRIRGIREPSGSQTVTQPAVDVPTASHEPMDTVQTDSTTAGEPVRDIHHSHEASTTLDQPLEDDAVHAETTPALCDAWLTDEQHDAPDAPDPDVYSDECVGDDHRDTPTPAETTHAPRGRFRRTDIP